MNIVESFATYLQDTLSLGTIGQDIYLGQAPSSLEAPDSLYWITSSGGDKTIKLKTGEAVKQYIVEIFHRGRDYKAVYDNMQDLEVDINKGQCPQLSGYDTLDIEATTFPVDNDLDQEDRKIGLLRVTMTVYRDLT